MARPTIENLRSLGDFATLFRWNLTFAQFPGAVASPPDLVDLNLRCESTTLPKGSQAMVETNIRGHKKRSNGIFSYEGSITFAFVETVDNLVAQFIKDWREAAWVPKTGVSAPQSELEAIILIQRLDNEDNAIWEYKLTGCCLEDNDAGGTLDGSTSDHLKPGMTISYDYFEEKSLV